MVSQRYEIGPLNKHGIYQIYSKYNWYILIPKYCNSNLTKNQHTRNCMSCPLEYTYNIHQYPKFGVGIATTWHHTLLATLPVAFSRLFCPSADTCGLSRKERRTPGAPGEANACYWLLLGTILNTMEYHAPWHWFCPPSSTTNPFSAAGGSCDSCGRLIWVASPLAFHPLWGCWTWDTLILSGRNCLSFLRLFFSNSFLLQAVNFGHLLPYAAIQWISLQFWQGANFGVAAHLTTRAK